MEKTLQCLPHRELGSAGEIVIINRLVLGREINTIYLRDYTNTPYGENIMGKVS
jgi:hypothetical protein